MEKPFLFDLVDWAYHGIMDNMPEYLQERSMASAFALGFTGNYLLVKGVQWASNKIMPEGFNKDILPIIEDLCIYLTVASPLMYGLINPQGLQEIVQEHPTYTTGMFGASLSAILTAKSDIDKKRLDRKL